MEIKLRDYQIEAIDVMKATKEKEKTLIALPTGSGKTVIFASLVSQVEGRVLIVVPSSELREQAIDKIKIIDPNIDIGSVQAQLDEVNAKVIVATRQSLTHSKSTRIKRMLSHGNFEYIIIDECHQAVDQIIKILSKINKNVKTIGLTATPFNPDMSKIFKKINCSRSIIDMIMQDYLVEPLAIMVQSKTNLSHVKTVAGEFNQKELELTVNTNERNQLVVEAYKKYAHDRKRTLVFCTGIDHLNSVVSEFKRNGIQCKGLDSTNDKEYRKDVIEEFSNGSLSVLANVGILTTGFDVPETDCILLARPTKSKILYTQILGRGLRKADNKNNCLIIDINDVVKNHDLINIESIFNVNIKSGETLRKAIKRKEIEKLKEEERKRKEEERRRQEEERKQREIELIAERVNLFNKTLKHSFNNAKYDWYKVNESTYALSYMSDNHYIISIKCDIEGNTSFLLYEVKTGNDERYCNFIKNSNTLDELIFDVEENIITHVNSFIKKESSWKSDPATLKQKEKCHWFNTKWDAHKYFAKYKINKTINF